MRNHNEKTRDMARSILPSTGRHLARDRKAISARRARARQTVMLTQLKKHLDDPDSFEGALDHYDLIDTGFEGMVWDRRDADKIAPIMRWAEARIERDPALAAGDYWTRRNYFAGILGQTKAGRHALSHLDSLFGEENPYSYGLAWWRENDERRERELARRCEEAATTARMLDEVLEGADARRLNARVKALTPPLQELWSYSPVHGRDRSGQTGCEPWLFDGDREGWLTVPRRRSFGTSSEIVVDAQRIAFEALRQVHVEMFGAPESILRPCPA